MMTYTKAIACLSVVSVIFSSCRNNAPQDDTGWRVYGGSKKSQRYSSLTQIDTSNVKQLQVAWTYHTNDADLKAHSQIQCNPIMVNGLFYGTTPKLRLFALDAATGAEKWVFNPAGNTNSSPSSFGMNNNRGVTYWEDGDDRRILYCAGSSIYALNAENGQLINGFGNGGKVDLHNDLGRNGKDLYVTATTPGIIYKDIYIVGSRCCPRAYSCL
jgi:quinoprotein glucose dehydrogenase